VSRAESGALVDASVTAGVVNKPLLLGTVLGAIVVLDYVTKSWAMSSLAFGQSVPVLGDFLRLTYTHNPGAAFGIHVGEHSRAFFLVLSLFALVVLALVYRSTSARDWPRLLAVSLVAGGAVGNILDRLRFDAGVVDFLDVGIGRHRWPIFNVADMAVSTGAVLLLISFYLEDRGDDESELGVG